MDFEYYAIFAVIVLIVLIAAFSYVNDVSSWGPDLTDEMPLYLISQSLSKFNKKTEAPDLEEKLISEPSEPVSRPTAPLLKYYRATPLVGMTKPA